MYHFTPFSDCDKCHHTFNDDQLFRYGNEWWCEECIVHQENKDMLQWDHLYSDVGE